VTLIIPPKHLSELPAQGAGCFFHSRHQLNSSESSLTFSPRVFWPGQ